MAPVDFVDYIDMNLNDENITPWDGQGGSNKPIPDGEYEFEIKMVEKQTSKKGNPTLVVDLEVVTDGEAKGLTCRQWYSLKQDVDASRRRMKSLILASGIALDGQGGFSAQQLVGAHFIATVRHEEYEDMNAQTGQPVTKTGTRVISERPVAPPEKAAPTPPPPRTRVGANGPQARK